MRCFRLLWLLLLFQFNRGYAAGDSAIFVVDYDAFLSKHDIVYLTPAYRGFEGFPLGNGDLGGMIWCSKNGLEIQVNKNDLFDQPNEESRMVLRSGAHLSIDFGVPCFNWIHLDDFEGRLSLGMAMAKFEASTPFSDTKVESWIMPDENVWIIACNSQLNEKITGGSIATVSMERWGSRAFAGWYGGYSKNTSAGLGMAGTSSNGADIVLKERFGDLDFAVVCRVVGSESVPEIVSSHRAELRTGHNTNHRFYIMVSVVTSNESDDPEQTAKKLLDSAEKKMPEPLFDQHLQWWQNFWSRSFVHIGNDYMENIYYLRRYLMASSSRGRYPVVFNGGLWQWNYDVRNWVTPHHWNTQQQYWGICAQNDCDLLLPYLNTYNRLVPQAEAHAKMRGAANSILWSEAHDFAGTMTFWDRGDMINNFTPASQIAGFFWEYYQYTADTIFLREKGFPFMTKAAEFYLQYLQFDSTKQEYFIFPSQPYESPRSNQLRNSVTDRNMIESSFKHCIQAAAVLEEATEKISEWQHVIDHLWPLPLRDLPGTGEVVELAWSPDGSIYPSLEDRGDWVYHFSANTSMVFPANLVGLDQAGTRLFNAAVRIVNSHPPYRNAISPDPIVAARLGLGDIAARCMENGIRRLQHFPQGLFYNIDHWYVNSIYVDSLKAPDISAQRDYIYDSRSRYAGSGLPTEPFVQCGMEPLSIYGAAVNEMLLQSEGDKLRVFPALPGNWPAAFTLRAKGAFLVSAEKRADGSIPAVLIKSLKGAHCVLVNPWPGKNVVVCLEGDINNISPFQTNGADVITFNTVPGKSYVISPAGSENMLRKKTIFGGDQNMAPKRFHEAILGKDRDF